ncbi:cupin domain-containing protein [Georgenia subflava]|uniref:cupin domain-containing protein n=1 Tax=Georgenia subflava TaxID=1622177 RepID=UPI00186B164E|nr:cupin domain-containing protein [Georgenia subflava]
MAEAVATDTALRYLHGQGATAGVAVFAAGETFRAHYHREVTEVFVCTLGTITISIGGTVHELRPGEVAVAPPGVVHQTSNRSGSPAEFFYIKTPGDMDDFVWVDHETQTKGTDGMSDGAVVSEALVTDQDVPGRFFPEQQDGRRVVVLDSATHSHRHAAAGGGVPGQDVVVNASYAGVYCARLLQETNPLGTIGIDCGIGKDGAGIAGLWYFEALGVPAAAADIMTVELGNGRELWEEGVISRVNGAASVLGIEPGQSVQEAAARMLAVDGELPPPDPYNRQVVEEGPGGHNVVVTNSIADALPEDKDTNVLCTAGHTGRSVVEYIVGFRPYGFICSDGGVGKNDSGLTALEPANDAGIAGAAVSAQTARMGDGKSTWADGVISAMNDLARDAGVTVGMSAREAAHLLVARETGGA